MNTKAVLITGASRGIGRALCAEAIERGYQVHALVRNADQAPPGTKVHVGDVRDRESMDKLFAEIGAGLSLYIANAGLGYELDPAKPDAAEKAAQMLDVNVTATLRSVYALAYLWIHGGAPRGRRIAVVSSLASGLGFPRSSVYAASKTAELVACQGLEHDFVRHGIGVSVVMPGFIDTEMSAATPQRPFLLTAQQSARIIFDGLERGRFRIAFPGPTAALSGFFRGLPELFMRPLVSFLHKKKVM
jgi:NAD(P)-dependent dehydrogenase (short-subunit alcohol dehydrogenase family)